MSRLWLNKVWDEACIDANGRGRGLGLLLACCLFPATVLGAYPEKPVRFIVPYAAGGPVEGTIRIFSNSVGKLLGQPLVIEAKAGGNTIIGSEYVAKSPPDGYTMLIMSPAHAANRPVSGNRFRAC